MAEAPEVVNLSNEEKEVKASKLYSEGYTFAEISDVLDCSKSFAQELCRRGISQILEAEKGDNPQKEINNPVSVEQSQIINPQMMPETFMLETTGIGRKLSLTPADLMVFDLWKAQGFEGDLSDFVSDCIQYLYQVSRPRERGPLLR